MSVVKEFKEFAMKGNVIDLAVGVVIGAAFGKIVTSLVSDIMLPPLGLLTGGIDFNDMKLVIKHGDAAKKIADVTSGGGAGGGGRGRGGGSAGGGGRGGK